MSPQFIHLRLHSEFSVVDGIVRLGDAVKSARADGQGALALTDGANLFGAIRFYKSARGKGVKPIIGCDLWITNEADRDNPFKLLVLAQNAQGYHSLCELLTQAWLTNQHRNRGEVRMEWLEGELGQGLIALSGGPAGEIAMLAAAGQPEAAQACARRLAAAFPGRFYLELQRAGRPGDEAACRAAMAIAVELGLPVVATHPVQFLTREDFTAHEARVCIAEGYTLSDPRRPKRFTEEQYLKTQAEMAELFADVPVALANAVEIARRCNLELVLGKPQLPLFPTPEGVSLDDYARQLSYEGLEKRLKALYPNEEKREEARPRYNARLDMELGIIATMGFPGYFLIVQDFINWAKNNDIPVGPGRGSGAGSLVAYSLGITDLDPLKYDLLFERFLNPERVSMPDFDIDFCQDNRDKVIDYVKRTYGFDAVSQIATFGTLGAKAVVRDAGRVLDMPYTKCDQLSKLIPHNPADPWSLDRALKEEPAFAEAVNNDEENQQLIELARPLEGLTRNIGMHAGGVLIAPGKLTDFCPLYAAGGAAENVISQYDKDDVEAAGLVKFDFLGLTTLTILAITLEYVRELHPGIEVDLDHLPLDDQGAYEIFKSANTAAIFQFESRGMRELLKRAKPDRLEDLIALNALYRPGPMDLIPDYIERKHGRQQVEYLDPRMEEILGETYGIMVYQEQVMRIAQTIGGYSLGGADLLRRAMGKKKPEEMAKHRGIFVEGAGKNGVSAEVATELFDVMEKFAGYGFNKSHSAAYAYVAFQTAYFKAHHAAAFMAANMCAVMDATDKLQALIEDAKDNGLKILPPDINAGGWRFAPVDTKTIRYGLGGVKGTGQSAIEAIVAEREKNGPYEDIFDLALRVDKQLANRRVIEALVKAGAFDALDSDRGKLLASVGRAIEAADNAAASANQESLFGPPGETERIVEYVKVRPWSEREKLSHEKTALGFYLSGHLFTEFREEARRIAPTRLADVKPGRDSVRLAGIVVSVRQQQTRRGRMGVLTIDDGSAQLELMIYSEVYDRRRGLLKEDELVFVSGKVRFDEFSQRMSVSAEDVMDLATARANAQAVLALEFAGATEIAPLKAVLEPYRSNGSGGGCRLVMKVANARAEAELLLPEAWRVRGDQALVEELRHLPQVRAAGFRYH